MFERGFFLLNAFLPAVDFYSFVIIGLSFETFSYFTQIFKLFTYLLFCMNVCLPVCIYTPSERLVP